MSQTNVTVNNTNTIVLNDSIISKAKESIRKNKNMTDSEKILAETLLNVFIKGVGSKDTTIVWRDISDQTSSSVDSIKAIFGKIRKTLENMGIFTEAIPGVGRIIVARGNELRVVCKDTQRAFNTISRAANKTDHIKPTTKGYQKKVDDTKTDLYDLKLEVESTYKKILNRV